VQSHDNGTKIRDRNEVNRDDSDGIQRDSPERTANIGQCWSLSVNISQ
jgi:hypothetical protein